MSIFFCTPLWHFFDNLLCKNQKIRAIWSTRENIKKRHKNIEKKIRSLASETILMQGFFSPERREKKETLKKSTPEEKAVNKLFPAVLREKLQKN